ncbi:hypothetical protein BDDG_05295 [Blastomyces dermatitidis ATCC 18188]|uniref:Uncharacterized protein n=2 Tax=Ajellomyces dermatitidis TaxID=5039 RepID=F2TGF1_AJEDA|nr:hypothetical protein BDDG_05295 [Blastomyces dermatitidis ATCC 18188]
MQDPRRRLNRARQGNPPSSQTTNNQPQQNQHEEISRFSPYSSSPDSDNQSGHNQPQLMSAFSMDSSIQAASTTKDSTYEQRVDNVATTHDPAESNTTGDTTVPEHVKRDRELTLQALTGRALPTAASERTGENFSAGVAQNPQAAQIVSKSGHDALARRHRGN